MQIFGLDFTSAPSVGKPITCAVCELHGTRLDVLAITDLHDFSLFENFLAAAGPWVAAMDFPFSQPRRLVEALGWPVQWQAMVEHVAGYSRADFTELLREYRAGRPAGDKQHQRGFDGVAGALSPMMVHGVPVGLMFLEGAPRLARSEASILPCRPRANAAAGEDTDRVVLEGYPGLAARNLIGRESYKQESGRDGREEREAVRRRILAALTGAPALARYGIEVNVPAPIGEELTADGRGDRLDAVLCALQAAWAAHRVDTGYGIPAQADALEGWIVDPALLDGPGSAPAAGSTT